MSVRLANGEYLLDREKMGGIYGGKQGLYDSSSKGSVEVAGSAIFSDFLNGVVCRYTVSLLQTHKHS